MLRFLSALFIIGISLNSFAGIIHGESPETCATLRKGQFVAIYRDLSFFQGPVISCFNGLVKVRVLETGRDGRADHIRIFSTKTVWGEIFQGGNTKIGDKVFVLTPGHPPSNFAVAYVQRIYRNGLAWLVYKEMSFYHPIDLLVPYQAEKAVD